jgi:hypothetical protein
MRSEPLTCSLVRPCAVCRYVEKGQEKELTADTVLIAVGGR